MFSRRAAGLTFCVVLLSLFCRCSHRVEQLRSHLTNSPTGGIHRAVYDTCCKESLFERQTETDLRQSKERLIPGWGLMWCTLQQFGTFDLWLPLVFGMLLKAEKLLWVKMTREITHKHICSCGAPRCHDTFLSLDQVSEVEERTNQNVLSLNLCKDPTEHVEISHGSVAPCQWRKCFWFAFLTRFFAAALRVEPAAFH